MLQKLYCVYYLFYENVLFSPSLATLVCTITATTITTDECMIGWKFSTGKTFLSRSKKTMVQIKTKRKKFIPSRLSRAFVLSERKPKKTRKSFFTANHQSHPSRRLPPNRPRRLAPTPPPFTRRHPRIRRPRLLRNPLTGLSLPGTTATSKSIPCPTSSIRF